MTLTVPLIILHFKLDFTRLCTLPSALTLGSLLLPYLFVPSGYFRAFRTLISQWVGSDLRPTFEPCVYKWKVPVVSASIGAHLQK